MTPRPHALLPSCLLAAALGLLLAGPTAAADRPTDAALDHVLQGLVPLARTGVLIDRVLPLARVGELDGSVNAPASDLRRWRQAYDELRRATLGAPAGPTLAALEEEARASVRAGVIPIALFDLAYDRVRPDAIADGSLRMTDGRVEAVGASPLVSSRAVAAAVLAPPSHRGGDLLFSLERSRFVSDETGAPRAISIDFADGGGPRPVAFGERVRVRYADAGSHVLEALVTRADGSQARARFTFEVKALVSPSPDDTLHITATVPHLGRLGTGDAYVLLAPGHTSIVNPVVVVEGFDLDNAMNWDELYALLNQESLIETLRSDGFDAVVLDFTDATAAIQENSHVVSELIQQVQAAIAPQATLALVGASMGGLCSRYALAYLEANAIPHRVRTWVSFDAPQAGADIPLGLQYWIQFFASQSIDAAAFLAVLDRPAAKQMLLYHFTTPAGSTGTPDPLRTQLLADLAALGDYPSLTRRVAVANGSGSALGQGFAPGDQLIRYEYSSLFLALTGNVWAVPDQTSRNIFVGSQRIVFTTTGKTVTVSGTQPWDGAPGGSRASMAQLDATSPPYGDIVALHGSHCFIPTVSSLALVTTDPFFDVSTAPDPLALTPFDAIFHPAGNEEHVVLSPASAAWIRNEIESGLLDAPSTGIAGRSIALATSPNPFASSTRLRLTLPRSALVDLRIFGVDGREVRRLIAGTLEAGAHEATWDGRDARGVPVHPGVYLARGTAGGESMVRRLVKLD